MYKVTFKLQTSFGQATQELFFLNKPTREQLAKVMADLTLDNVLLVESYREGLWEPVVFEQDSQFAGEILVEKVKVCDIAQ